MPWLTRLLVSIAIAACGQAQAQEHAGFWPGADYDPGVPTFADVLGYEPGERITWSRDVRRYFDALRQAAPDRVVIADYATSWEGRGLFYVAVSSPENVRRLAEIRDNMQRLADPRVTSEADAEAIIASQPAVTWLSYGVHGNEISSSEAAMLTAYHLLAARGDERVGPILRDTVVVIDPMQNPDGRDRFIHQFEIAEGLVPEGDRLAAEHDEPWPGGRTNHYLFDLNRDWFIRTQPETRGRADALLEWYPVAYVDAHEMGSDSTYYFAPEAVPYNPHLAEDQRSSLALFGRTNARWFDEFGLDYFTREVYDAFYPGYGASWPSYFGSIAMTYEQASARGLVFRQYDGNELTYAYTIRNHFVTSLGTAETVMQNREKLLRDFYRYQVTAIEEGARESVRAYVIPAQADQAGADKLAGLLAQQRIEVLEAAAPFRACGESYPAGSYVINLDQPAKRFIRTLMDPDVPLEEDFLAEQERRRAKNLPDEIYDVTAWSLPLMLNVRADRCNRLVSGDLRPVDAVLVKAADIEGGTAEVAYLAPWGTRPAARLLARALTTGLAVKSTDEAFTHQGRRYPAGTLIFDVADNPADLHSRLAALAAVTGAGLVAVNDSWVTDGPNFGSRKVVSVNAPRVAIAWDEPTSSYSAGNTRFVIERQFDYPATAIRVSRLASADLARYQVLVLPETGDGDYGAVLGEDGVANLRDWVERGGVLIGTGNATRFLSDPAVDLLAIRREYAVTDVETPEAGETGDEEEPPAAVPGTYLDEAGYAEAVTALETDPDAVAGVLVRATVDPDHWLGAGVASTLNVLVRGSDVYTPLRRDEGVNVARFAAADELVASGYLWDENRRQLAFKPFAVAQPLGAGHVVGFTQDPNVRAYLDGLNVLFMNAIFRGAAHARPVR